MVKTTVMEAVLTKAETRVVIQRHPTDFQTLSEDVQNRVVATLTRNSTGCIFFNPAVTVSCPSPAPEFFRIVRKEQARWCRQARKTFPKHVCRSASNWVSGGEWITPKYARYLDRALCFMGILFIDGQLVLPHNWPKEVPAAPKIKSGTTTTQESQP